MVAGPLLAGCCPTTCAAPQARNKPASSAGAKYEVLAVILIFLLFGRLRYLNDTSVHTVAHYRLFAHVHHTLPACRLEMDKS
jgi:hypothetical protein